MWTRFRDMHSGGSTKQGKYDYIYIEAPCEEAEVIFYNRFGHNPNRVSCTCCGEDYSIDDAKTLAEVTGYERGCKSLRQKQYKSGAKKGLYKPLPTTFKRYYEINEDPPKGYEFDDRYKILRKSYVSLREYLKKPSVLVVYKDDIKPEERLGDVPEEGYVWV